MAFVLLALNQQAKTFEIPRAVLFEEASARLPVSAQTRLVCSAYDAGVCADVGHFYQMNKELLRKFTLLVELSSYWGLRTQFTEGASASKLAIRERVLVGLIGVKPLSSKGAVTAELFGTIGGDIRHRPCMDDYDREYYCGNLTAWQDYPDKRVSQHEYGLKLAITF